MATRPATAPVPPFLVLAGHPVRWQVLVELAGSDLQVGELVRALGRPQALVSYHLARLRSGGLVSSRRSSFDGWAAYYRVHLDRCGELLAATGTALHPGLRLGGAVASAERPAPASGSASASGSEAADGRRPSVLFVCTGNGTRSQIAEALLRDRVGERVEVASAGSHPKPIHPNAVAVLAERGIDISAARSKPLAELADRRVDYVVTLCDVVREICPELPGRPRAIHWSIEDPSRLPGTDAATLPAFRAITADLDVRIGSLVSLIHHDTITTPPKEHTRHA